MLLLLPLITLILAIQGCRNYGFWRTFLGALSGSMLGLGILICVTIDDGLSLAVVVWLLSILPIWTLTQVMWGDRQARLAAEKEWRTPRPYRDPSVYTPPYPDLVRNSAARYRQRQESRR